MPLCDYFSAADDQAAVAGLQALAGPAQRAHACGRRLYCWWAL
ncbi:hypothetical protein [Streptomyces sp. NPDC002553]